MAQQKRHITRHRGKRRRQAAAEERRQEIVEDGVRQPDIGEGEQEYVQYLEKKLENILMQMDGVGRVDVMITVSDGGEQIVEKDKKTTSSSTGERDSGGGERSVTEQAGEDSTVYVETADEKYPYVQKETLPTVAGVVVVAEGGGNPAAVSEISESVQALLKVEPHRIRVVKMCSREESE